MGIVLWLLFGGLIGWLASIVTGDDSRLGILGNIVVGLVGSIIGGFISKAITGKGINVFTWYGFGFSILCAIILLSILNLIFRRRY